MTELLSPDSAYAGANLLLLLVVITLSTVFFICFSGFVKYSIVLNIIKNAIGTQQIPPSIVINLLAALMALNSLWPTLQPGLERITPFFVDGKNIDESLLAFRNSQDSSERPDINMYYIVSNIFEFFPELLERAKQKTEELNNMVEIPLTFDEGFDTFRYFIGSLVLDLYQGFELGLKLYMVFVSIDFLIAVVLSGVGMTMLSPTVISTPIKLAVFYFSDSWTVLFSALE